MQLLKSMEQYGLEKLFERIEEISVHNVKSNRGPFKSAFEGSVIIGDKEVTIQIALPKHFPKRKPMYFLKEQKEVGFIPHTEPDGFICYSYDEGLLLDQSNPFGIVEESFQRAIQTLKDGVFQKNNQDFIKEFEALWSRQKGSQSVDSIITPTETFKKLLVFLDSRTGKTIVLDGINSEIQRYINKLYKVDVLKEFEQFKGIYVPLREGTYIEPPPFQEFWDMKKLRNVIFDNITGSTKRRLNRYLKSRTFDDGEKEYIIISIPIRTGQRGMVGILLSDFKKNVFAMKRTPIQHPLKKNKSQFEMIGLRVKRHDKDYLLNRTQGNNTLVDKKVTVIGLGSLGSRITFELARAGVSEFMLIDKDVLDIDNIYRHELGVTNLYWKGKDRYYNISKVEALMLELHERFPALKIEYENADILDVIDEECSLITNSDLVVVALGSPTEELYLNKVLYGLKDSPPTIYSWLDPLGIGGHALLTNNMTKQGSFRCLFTPFENSNEIVPNQASFASPNQYFAKSLAGCDSVFTVYGSMDALQTAIIATRLAVRVLNQEEGDNALISWKGDSLELIKQGFKTSPRYEFTSEELFEYRYLYKRGNCPVCGVGENCDL